jgi:DNA repair protein RadC
MKKCLVYDDGGFYALPTRTLELIQLTFPNFTSVEHKLVKGLIDRGQPITLEDLNFLSIGEISQVLACIELGRKAWEKPIQQGTIVESPLQAYSVFAEMLRGKKDEHFAVIFLDVKNKITGREIVSIGLETQTLVPVKKILRLAITKGQGLIVAHNHPSGSLEPSLEDMSLTRHLLEACEIVDIKMLDHLIVTDRGFASLRQATSELPWRE